MSYDVIIIGAGVAGLYTAINIPKNIKVLIINKSYPWECNTFYAQGGVATALNVEDIQSHIHDTLSSGAFMGNEESVNFMSTHSMEAIGDIRKRGFSFDLNDKGELAYTKEAAHSQARILHAGGDATGRYLHYFLLAQNKHTMLSNTTVIDLLFDGEKCCGVSVLSDKQIKKIYAKNVVIASGGVGSLFEYHTNAKSISSDLHGICLEHDILLENMEMTQFHPTVYVGNRSARKLLLTEALRGEGAHIVDDDENRFVFEYDSNGELAARDIVSRAIFDYKEKSGKQVYLSMKNFNEDYFKKRFPNIYKTFKAMGYDIPTEKVPISPAFHYSIGGIACNLDGQVAGRKSLYVVGEAASTGVHGANRLASNSLLEGLVFAKKIADKIVSMPFKECHTPLGEDANQETCLYCENDKEKKDKLRRIMWKNVSIVRSDKGLKEAHKEVSALLDGNVGRLLKLRLLSAMEIIVSAMQRKESVGVHYIKEE